MTNIQEKIFLEIFFSISDFNFKYRCFQVSNSYFWLHFYCDIKIKTCIKLSYLTAGRAVEKTTWVSMQMYILIEAENILIYLVEKRNID